MSNLTRNIPNTARRTVETESSYEGAERAVDWLSDQQFPVEHVSIVGTGLRYVEQVSGRVTTANAALKGAGQGAMLGLLFGLFFGLFFTGTAFFGVLIYGLIAGTFWGVVWGTIVHYAQGGRRDFGSTAQTRADQYEIQVDDGFADEALRVLGQMPGRNGSPSAQAT
jgi:hypothetical protein